MRRAWGILALVLTVRTVAAEPRPQVRIGYSRSVTGWVDPSVVEASSRALMDVVLKRAGLSYSFGFVEDNQIITSLRRGTVNFVFATGLEYVATEEKLKIAPVARAQMMGKASFRLLLLVRKRDRIQKLEALRGKTVSFFPFHALSRHFVDLVVAREGIKRTPLFGRIVEKSKPQSPVLDLLLGEADACVTSDFVLGPMAELNPQVRRDLVVLRESETVSHSPFFGLASDAVLLQRIRRVATTLHETSQGRQLLLIFGLDRLAPAQASDFESLRKIARELHALRKDAP